MLYTTFAKLHEFGACTKGYIKLARSLGGVKKYGKDTPIPLDKIIESNGLQDTIWTFRAIIDLSHDLLNEFACRCAEHVLYFYEEKYPEDKRPRKAIEAARVCITDKSPEAAAVRDAWAAAGAGAARAAWAAAGAGAARAAWAAAWGAEAAARAAAEDAWAAVGDAAVGAARAAAGAAWAAVGDAAAGAARAAEEQWQIEQLLELLSKS